MIPDLAMLVLIAVYTGLAVSDTISTWSIERKSRKLNTQNNAEEDSR